MGRTRTRRRPRVPVALLLVALLGAAACEPDVAPTRAGPGGAASDSAAQTENRTPAGAVKSLIRTGMDPGMTRRLAATLYPVSRSYTEFCPDSPTGKCHGTLRSGDRFYTLAANMSGPTVPLSEDKTQCRIGSREPVLTNTGPTACPYHFAWRQTATGRPAASVLIDTTAFPTTQSAYAYFGLQENVGTPLGHVATGRPSSEIYAGLPAEESDTYRPLVRDIERLDVDLRARLCLGRHAGDAHYGRVIAYLLWYDSATGRGTELSIDLLTYKKVPPGTVVPIGEYFYEEQQWWHENGGGPKPDPKRWVGHIDGRLWGLVPPQLTLQRDGTKDCSGRMAGAPVHLEIPVGKVLKRLVAEGLIEPERLSGRYVGAIVNGVETWGRGQLESEVSGFTLWRRR